MFYFSCHTFTNTFRTQRKYRDPGSISSSYLCRMQTYCGLFCLSDYPKHKSIDGRNDNHHIVAFCNFRWPLVFPYFGLHFRLVTFLCRNRFPGTRLHMAAVAKTVVTSKFDLCCRPFLLSEQAWPTRVTPLLISCQKFVWNSLCYQKHSIILGTKGKSTFHLIRHTYVPGTCMYAMNTSYT